MAEPRDLAAQRPAPNEAELRAAVAATPVVMFSATWCKVCDRARDFLRANGCFVRERDIDRDPAARRILESRFGRVGVPTLEIDGRMQEPGFSEGAIARDIAASVERRLGIQGIRVQPGR